MITKLKNDAKYEIGLGNTINLYCNTLQFPDENKVVVKTGISLEIPVGAIGLLSPINIGGHNLVPALNKFSLEGVTGEITLEFFRANKPTSMPVFDELVAQVVIMDQESGRSFFGSKAGQGVQGIVDGAAAKDCIAAKAYTAAKDCIAAKAYDAFQV